MVKHKFIAVYLKCKLNVRDAVQILINYVKLFINVYIWYNLLALQSLFDGYIDLRMDTKHHYVYENFFVWVAFKNRQRTYRLWKTNTSLQKKSLEIIFKN